MDYSDFAFPKKAKIKDKKAFEKINCKECLLCGQKSKDISRHHVIPRSYRRLDHVMNLVPLCEYGLDGKPGCHKLVESERFDEITCDIMANFMPDRIAWLREESKDWSFWLYYDKWKDK